MPATVSGSSPRMRGTHGLNLQHSGARRFIPAHAGNAHRLGIASTRCQVHPRACGERFVGLNFSSGHSGSSPRMRGTLRCRRRVAGLLRFIPAHAGNARAWGTGSIPTTVHPRACGERVHDRTVYNAYYGSSPRMRGTPKQLLVGAFTIRFIPAHAGNATDHSGDNRDPAVHPRACGERSELSGRSWPSVGSSPRMRGTRPNCQ